MTAKPTKVTAYRWKCRCGHVWTARIDRKPLKCPKCYSYRWEVPKRWEWAKKGRRNKP